MPTTKKMPMNSAILLALIDARNNISDHDQANKLQDLIDNQMDDMTPIVTSEPNWIRRVLQAEVKETFEVLAQPIMIDCVDSMMAWRLLFAAAAEHALETIETYISMAGGDAR